LAAGLAQCTADCAVIMAADLQDPPELAAQLVERWQAGHDVVWGVRAARQGEHWQTRVASRAYWALMRAIMGPQTPAAGADVVLLGRPVIDALNAAPEKNTSLLALIQWLGFRQTHVSYVKAPRAGGRSGWTLSKRVKLALDSVLSFSSAPIRLTWLAGIVWLAAAALWTLTCLIGWLAGGVASPLLALLLSVVLAGVGSLLVGLGLVGEYVWRAYDSARGRPRFVIERYLGTVTAPSPPTASVSAAASAADASLATATTPQSSRRTPSATARVYT
jgi:dolichol-phosphate mannosyltransferase